MTSRRDLFPQLPPGVDPTAPEILAWRQARMEEVIAEHDARLQAHKTEPPSEPISWRQIIAIAILLLIGLKSRASPEFVNSLAGLAARLLLP